MSQLKLPQEKINPILELFTNGQIQEALDAVDVLSENYPDDSLLFNIRGACFAGLGQNDAAVESYKKAVLLKPSYAKAHYNLGGALQETGQLDEAVKSYESAIALEPENAEAHNNLGNVLRELAHLNAAIKSYKKAIVINPGYVEAHYSLGLTFYDLGQLQDTVKSYKQVLTIKPDFAEMHNNLGNVYRELDELDAALKSYQKAITIKPDFVEAYYSLGITLKGLGKLDFAIKSYEDAIAINPNYAEAYNELGIIYLELGTLEVAVQYFKKALVINPAFFEVFNNLGIAYKDLGSLHEALKSYKNAIAIKPSYIEARNNLGIAFIALGMLGEAINCFKELLSIKPGHSDGLNNLGIVFKELGQFDDAIKYHEQALIIEPEFAEAYINIGNIHKILKNFDDAVNYYDKAIAIRPHYSQSHSNRGSLMADFDKWDEALKSFERARDLKSNQDYILGDLLHTKMHLCLWDDLSVIISELLKNINNGKKVIIPFALIAFIDNPALQRKATEIYANDKFPISNVLPKIEHYPKHKKIRIGYFSADFREHPVTTLTVGLYEEHDRSQFEIYAFSYGPDTKDEMNLRVKTGVDHFYDVRLMPLKDIALLSRFHEIDIAIDLGGFTQDSRTGIFAMLAAPIQLSYIGYLGTMGMNYYNYLIADLTIIPKESQQYYSEKIVYLPSFQANDLKQSQIVTSFNRKDIGLPEKGFVFCCFNNTYKITPLTLDSWAQILKKVEDSVLIVFASNESAQINLTKEISLRNINPGRLIFGERLSRPEYLGRFKVVDLFLDTHPYNAGTTSSDALRMGLPVLTCLGKSFASRMGSSILNSINLPELITTSQKDYEALAIELATNPKKMKLIKDKLAKNLPSAPLYDTPLFTKHLESAYKTIYDRHHEGLEPDHIYVEHSNSSNL